MSLNTTFIFAEIMDYQLCYRCGESCGVEEKVCPYCYTEGQGEGSDDEWDACTLIGPESPVNEKQEKIGELVEKFEAELLAKREREFKIPSCSKCQPPQHWNPLFGTCPNCSNIKLYCPHCAGEDRGYTLRVVNGPICGRCHGPSYCPCCDWSGETVDIKWDGILEKIREEAYYMAATIVEQDSD